MKLWKHSGTYLWITGALHSITCLVMGREMFLEMIRKGVLNSIGEDFTLGFAFWSLMFGILLTIFGCTLQYFIRTTQKSAPKFIGYALLLFSTLGCVIMPVSGFWLCIPQALIIIFANRKFSKN